MLRRPDKPAPDDEQIEHEQRQRDQRCEQAAAAMKVPFLRDVDMTRLEASKDDMPVMAYRRALHVVGENERVAAAETALKAGDLQALGKLLLASHESSRNNFENSCEELDILVSLAEDLPGFYGGRLSGGGFGGISIHLVEKDQADEFSNLLASAFEARTGNRPATMICEIGPGASVSNLE